MLTVVSRVRNNSNSYIITSVRYSPFFPTSCAVNYLSAKRYAKPHQGRCEEKRKTSKSERLSVNDRFTIAKVNVLNPSENSRLVVYFKIIWGYY